jgi:hypothetical protein
MPRTRRALSPARAVSRLAAVKGQFGPGTAAVKLELLRAAETAALRTASQVRSLHESLCFLHAYPDDPDVFALVRRMLASFETRADLRRHRRALENSGVAGTDIVYPFGASTARWLAGRHGDRLTVAWGHGEQEEALETRLPLLTLWSERAVFDEPPLPLRPWIDRLRGRETDASFLVRRSAACTGTSLLGDQLYDELGLTLRLAPGAGTPSRTLARLPRRDIVCQSGPLRTGRPDLREAARTPPGRVIDVGRRDAARLIHLAREAMVTRERDLYSFVAADPRDVRVIDCGDGLELACYGVHPEQRLLLDAVYSFLMLRNGVPVGYALASALWRSSEIAYNVFESYRGAEAAWVYGRILAVMHTMFGADSFTIFPYQLGHENAEGLESGAWWFYAKLGFRPRDPRIASLAAREAARVRRRPGYRTPPSTLRTLVTANLFLDLGAPRRDVLGDIPTERIGLAASDLVASRFGADRERATVTLAVEAASRLGVRDWRQWPSGEWLFWERWAPLVALLPGLDTWTGDERGALVEIIRAKGGRRESDYVARFDAHPRLGAALASLARAQG